MRERQDLIRDFRQKGLKITPQRLLILELLKDNRTHPSAEDIHKQLVKTHPTISLATVYKTLETLTKLGKVKELNLRENRIRYDPDTQAHSHLICEKCNQIIDLHSDFVRDLRLPKAYRGNFVVTEKHVEFYGICQRCLKKRKKAL